MHQVKYIVLIDAVEALFKWMCNFEYSNGAFEGLRPAQGDPLDLLQESHL
jgi:hypothetical protein